MSRAGSPFLMLAVLAFGASTLAFALGPNRQIHAVTNLLDPLRALAGTPRSGVDLVALFLDPQGLSMMALLLCTWIALLYHAGRRWLQGRRMRIAQAAAIAHDRALPPHSAGPPVPRDMLRRHARDDTLGEHGPLIAGLIAGAIWPWLLDPYPLAAFLLSALMLAGFLAAALRGIRIGDLVHRSSTLGFAAGWAMLVCMAVFAQLLHQRLGTDPSLAGVTSILIGAFAGVCVQLRMPHRIGFSIALIWGLIGIASSSVGLDIAIATATVLAIAIIAVALVRVTT